MGGGLLVRASSRNSSSELGAFNQSTRLTFANSRPMTGVTSKYSNCSRTPLDFRYSLGVERAAFLASAAA